MSGSGNEICRVRSRVELGMGVISVPGRISVCSWYIWFSDVEYHHWIVNKLVKVLLMRVAYDVLYCEYTETVARMAATWLANNIVNFTPSYIRYVSYMRYCLQSLIVMCCHTLRVNYHRCSDHYVSHNSADRCAGSSAVIKCNLPLLCLSFLFEYYVCDVIFPETVAVH